MLKKNLEATIKKHLAYLDEVGYDLDFRDLYNYHNDIWVTRNHTQMIPLSEMENGHIKNAISLINNDGPLCIYGLGPIWLPKLWNELKRRGVTNGGRI